MAVRPLLQVYEITIFDFAQAMARGRGMKKQRALHSHANCIF
jgi:hypothetical protein